MDDLGLDNIVGGIKIGGKSCYAEAEQEVWASIPLWISTGCSYLNYAIGGHQRGRKGGIPVGRVCEISGPESSAKSSLLDHIIRETLWAGGAVFLADAEHAHLPERLQLIGADLSNFRFLQKPRSEDEEESKKKKGKQPTGEPTGTMVLEEFFEIAESTFSKFRKSVGENVPIVIALDSLAAIETKAQAATQEQNMKDKLDKASVLAQQFGGFCSNVTQNGGSVIIVNQLRTNPGAWGDKLYTPGGSAKDYHFSLRIRMDSAKPIRAKDDHGKDEGREYLDNDVTGIEVSGRITKNKVAEPFRKFRFSLFFDKRGIDDSLSFTQLITDRERWRFSDRFKKEGNTFSFDDEKLGVGEAQLAEAIAEDPSLRIEMEEDLFGRKEEDE